MCIRDSRYGPVKDGEEHLFNPKTIELLQESLITVSYTHLIISGLNEGDKVITTDGTFELGESVKL